MTDETNKTDEFARKKLTEWVNEPTLLDLKSELTEAYPDHQHYTLKIDAWLDNLNVTGAAKPKKIKGHSSIQPKLIRKQSEWRCAALVEPFLSTEDLFNLEPVAAGDKKSAIQNSLIINNQFNTKINKTKFIDDYIHAAVNEGTFIARVGWDYADEEVETEVPVFEFFPVEDPQAMQQEQELHALMFESPDDYNQLPEDIRQAHDVFMQTGIPHVANQAGTRIETETKVLVNKPTVVVCDYKDVIIDPTAKGDPDKAEFIIYRFETSKSELEKSGIEYVNLNNIITETASPLSTADTDVSPQPSFSFKDEPRKKLEAYEYWGYYDIHGTGSTVPIVVTWVGETLIRMEENPFPDQKLPFVIRQYLPVKNSLYGEPDGALLEEHQKITGAVTRGMIDIMGRSANGQIGMRTDALDVANKRRFENGKDYEFNPTVDPRTAIINHTYPEIPQSAQFMLNMQNAEAEALTGVKAFSQGITGTSLGSTATGIRSALDATAKRDLILLRRIADGIIQIGRKIISMNAEFLSEVEIVRITNSEFVEIRRDDLAGNFDIKLSISTAEADNEKAQELSFMLQTVGPNTDPEMTYMIMADIARLRNMPELAKKLDNYQPAPDPLQQKKAELEIALLEAQVFNEQAKGQENSVDVGLKEAKTVTEQAKARQLGSTADMQDLDFLRKESGQDQEQEIEKKEYDRQAALDLKAADKMLAEDTAETSAI
ncbi:chromosome partitioning protein ParB [candidate division WWE3 bacterium]|nr:chromosome partitioning protein ParB [candidate division WWE3 bacterium]